MSVDILGTSWDQCRSMVQYSFTSTETRRLVKTDSLGRPPRLSHSSWTMYVKWHPRTLRTIEVFELLIQILIRKWTKPISSTIPYWFQLFYIHDKLALHIVPNMLFSIWGHDVKRKKERKKELLDHTCKGSVDYTTHTLRASLSGTFLQTLLELVRAAVHRRGHRPPKGLGTDQIPSTGLRHPSFNHCRI